MRRLLLILCFLAGLGSTDALRAQITFPNPLSAGGAAPATCTPGSLVPALFLVTTGSPPTSAVLNVCTAANTWATMARSDAAQTFTGVQTFSTPIALTSLAGTVVNATAPGVGLAHFAGSTQTVTSSAVVGADFGAAIAARAVLNNATAAAAAPAFSTTEDVLAYQVAEIPSQVEVCGAGGTGCAAGAFTTSGVGTALEAITGLSWTFPANTALNVPFDCHLIYHQNSVAVNVNFGFQDATVAPTNLAVQGTFNTSAAASTQQNLVGSSTTVATNIFAAATPSAITTNWNVDFWGYIEQPSNGSSSLFTIRTSTATAADTVTVVRGSYCHIGV